MYRDYTAQCLWGIESAVMGIGGQKNTMPQYVDIIHPESGKPKQTAEQIKQSILAKLRE